jgi:uncharacterized hydrophobic protein (TIGR00341 family)
MIFRLIEMVLPNSNKEEAERLLKEYEVKDYSYSKFSKTHVEFHIIIERDRTEEILDTFQKKFSNQEGFRIIIIPIDTYIPLPEEKQHIEEEEATTKQEEHERISREEIVSQVSEMSQLTKVYTVLVAASTLVASIGLINDDVAVIIGAMIIAPLIGPNIGLSLANVIGNKELAYRAIKTNVVGIFIAFFISLIMGMIFAINTQNQSIVLRTNVATASIFLALASGLAGSLAITTQLSATFVGVMIAVALLPPLAAFGLLVGSGNFSLAISSLILFLVNLVCINLVATLSFMAQKIRPLKEEESINAKKTAIRSIIIWISILIILFVLIRLKII